MSVTAWACFLVPEGQETLGAESLHVELSPEQVTPADHRHMSKPGPNQPSPDQIGDPLTSQINADDCILMRFCGCSLRKTFVALAN